MEMGMEMKMRIGDGDGDEDGDWGLGMGMEMRMGMEMGDMLTPTVCSWVPDHLLQAESRVHRVGQRNACLIYYVLANDTIDDLMWPILAHKHANTSAIIDGTASALTAQHHPHPHHHHHPHPTPQSFTPSPSRLYQSK